MVASEHKLKTYYWAEDAGKRTMIAVCVCGKSFAKEWASLNALGRSAQARALISHHMRLEREKEADGDRS